MYTIGRLARRAKVNVDSIRFYERQGLIASATKTDSGYRLYTDEALRRITFIKHAQRCGFSLAEVRELLHMHSADCAGRADAYRLAARKEAEIRQTMQALEHMTAALRSLLSSRPDDPQAPMLEYDESPVLRALEIGLARDRADAPYLARAAASA